MGQLASDRRILISAAVLGRVLTDDTVSVRFCVLWAERRCFI